MTYPVRFALQRARKTWETLLLICGALFLIYVLHPVVGQVCCGARGETIDKTPSPGVLFQTAYGRDDPNPTSQATPRGVGFSK